MNLEIKLIIASLLFHQKINRFIHANIFLAQQILVSNIMLKRVKPFNIIVHHKVRESSLRKSRNCVLVLRSLYKCTLKELQSD